MRETSCTKCRRKEVIAWRAGQAAIRCLAPGKWHGRITAIYAVNLKDCGLPRPKWCPER